MARGGRDGQRGGSSGGGSSRANMPRDVQVSKALSKLLRHGAEKEGLKLGAGGYINVKYVLNSRAIKPMNVSLSELSDLVASNEKQRFSLIPIPIPDQPTPTTEPQPQPQPLTHVSPSLSNDADPSKYLIRANQGHSIKLDETDLLTPITLDNLPTCVVHGTTRRAWPLILSSGGLKRMTRNHVHFATGLPAGFAEAAAAITAHEGESVRESESASAEKGEPVISGMRSSSAVLIYLDIKKAMDAGLTFWKSANGVVLCDGGEKDVIPLECFERVEERGTNGGILVQNGAVVGQLSSKGR